jgi:cytochrome c553
VNIRLACTTLALLATAFALPAAHARGSAETGATRAAICGACHGPTGSSVNPEWPNLAGQNAAYIERQLHLLHDDKRVGKPGDANAALMPAQAKLLSDQDMEDVAAYFSSQVPAGLEADPSYYAAGQKLYQSGDRTRGIPACSACHGPVGGGIAIGGYPALRAQHSVYVIKQLGNYASGERYTKDAKGLPTGGALASIMQTIASRLTDADKRDLASYIQGIR